MQYPTRYADLPEYAFPRLRRLLEGHAPGGPEIAMSLGEPQHPVPDMVGPIMLEHSATLSKYPPNDGIQQLRDAISAWLARRYDASEAYRDPDTQIFPLNGTREGLFSACVALCPERKNAELPAVLLPNPFYQCYTVAAVTAGAEPVYLPCTPETGYLPDFAALPTALLDRTAIAYVCSPANPQGVCADRSYWTTLLTLAEKHDFIVFADECYSEIYRNSPPVGALQVASDLSVDAERLMCFHSLSKRSNLAGLRSGFAVTGPKNRGKLLQMRSYVGAPMPIPAQHAAAAVWSDETHVDANRALYQEKYAIADDVLSNAPGYMAPEAGFFLWLKVNDGEAAALRLWKDAGVRSLPGKYLSRPVASELGGGDPGTQFLRLALVASASDVRRGLEAVRRVLL